MNVAQPLVFVLRVALGFVAEKDNVATTVTGAGFADLGDEPTSFDRVATAIRVWIAHRLQ